MRRLTLAIVVCVVPLACKSSRKTPDSPPLARDGGAVSGQDRELGNSADDARHQASVKEFLDWYLDEYPGAGSELGLHEYDGKLTDVSAKAIEAEVEKLKAFQTEFSRSTLLSEQNEYERQIILAKIRQSLFDIQTLRLPWRNPMNYMEELSVSRYISRDYAPAADRAKAIASTCEAAQGYLDQVRKNLEEAMPRTWVDTALLQTNGLIDFLSDDVPAAMTDLAPDDKKALDAGLDKCKAALAKHRDYLKERKKAATDDYALGADKFIEMLSVQGLDISLQRLEQIAKADLERNLASLEATAKQIDPHKTVPQVIADARNDRPPLDKVLDEASAQATDMKKFLIDHKIVSIPSDDVAEVKPSPPYMRWNFAFLDSAGPFEKKPLPSFYYISPPDPSWPLEVQKQYVASRADLLFVTIHEVWPGHFLHHLHAKQSTSKVARAFCNYAMGEGWAHYAEEMMWDAGVGDGDPHVHIGQLQNALLRNVRFVSAIGLHTKGMTVDESKKLFIEQGMQDEGNATQQAVRGTFDPGYLNYTLGKLMIRKLHDDWKAAKGDDYTLAGFHDEFLRWQCAPVPVIRKLMLGKDAGPAL